MIAPGRYALGAVSLVSLCCTTPTPIGVTGKVGDPVEVYCGRKRADIETVERITTRMSLGEITDALGEPARQGGSGIFVLEWDCTDGRRFSVSMNQPDPSSKPVALGFTK